MTKKQKSVSDRGTPLSDSIGADLNQLSSLLADHTRGLDAYLNRQSQHIQEREVELIEEAAALQLTQTLNLEALSKSELKGICRRKKLKGWSKLRQIDLIAFIRSEVGADLKDLESNIPSKATTKPKDLSGEIRELRKRVEQIERHVQKLDEAIQSLSRQSNSKMT